MAHPVEHDLGDRSAAVDRLETGFVIDRPSEAQQRAAAGRCRSPAYVERPGGMKSGSPANGNAALKRPRLVAHGAQVGGRRAAGRLDQRHTLSPAGRCRRSASPASVCGRERPTRDAGPEHVSQAKRCWP